MCSGADIHGETVARSMGIPVARFPADWEQYGRSAGVRRNAQMAQYADALIAVWDGESRGTKSMINLAVANGLIVFVYRFNEQAFANGENMVTEILIAESKAYRDLLAFLSLPDAEIVLGMEPTTISFENGTWTIKRDLRNPSGFTIIGQTNNMYEAMKIALN